MNAATKDATAQSIVAPTTPPNWDTFHYQAYTDRYVYPWKPPKRGEWAGTCREFVLTLKDRSVRTAWFNFVR